MNSAKLIELARFLRDGRATTTDTLRFLQAIRFELGEISKILRETKKERGDEC
jgi:hypothetical protein